MNKPQLSILIPARNEYFLCRTVKDILSNIEGDTGVIVVMDGYETELPKDPRLKVIHNKTSVGQREATNQACRLSEAKYVMKVDGHCCFDKGFDVKMLAEMQDDWTMVPIMRNLHAFDWVCPEGHRRYQGPSGPCKECGKPTVMDIVWKGKESPQSVSYCFDEEPHFQYFREYKKHPDYKKSLEETGLTETMSLQGSCFMMTREKYWELDISSDETFGSWGSQGIEVACKTWLSGGRVVVNHKTWYAHMFRTQGGDFGFPYPQSGKQVSRAKKTARELFFDNKWDKQVRPLSWLLEKFWPIPGWTEEMKQKIKAWPLMNQPNTSVSLEDKESAPAKQVKEENEPSVGILYYTDNCLDERVMNICQKQLQKATKEKNIEKILSVSLKPMDFGENIALPLERSYYAMYKQVLIGIEMLNTDIIFFAEHDVLYHPSHFNFIPPQKDKFYYNGNFWCLRASDGFALYHSTSPASGICAYRETLLTHYRERMDMIEKEGFSYHIGFEPMTHRRIKWKNWFDYELRFSDAPNIDIAHGKNLTRKRWSRDQFRRKPAEWIEADINTIPGWDNVETLLRRGGITINQADIK